MNAPRSLFPPGQPPISPVRRGPGPRARLHGCAVILALVLAAFGAPGEEAGKPAPKVLHLELAVLRFKPATNEQVFADYKLSGRTGAVVDSLRAIGRSVDILYYGTRSLVLEGKASAKFDATETRPVILIGKTGTAPPAVVYGLTMQVSLQSTLQEGFVLGWDGSLNWSPDLLDRRSAFPNALQLLGKAAGAAGSITEVTGKSQATEIGLAVADLFKSDAGTDSSIYELPVLKTASISGSRVCHGGETIINLTAAEAGTKEPQIIFFVLNTLVE